MDPFAAPANTPPTISDVADRTIGAGGTTGPLAFTVGDLETPAASLVMSGASSNTALVPMGGIVFGGAGAARTVTVQYFNGAGAMFHSESFVP